MTQDYLVVGGGLAAASAVEGIRAHDPTGTIVMLSRDNHAPYHRPPLTKDLWFGRSTKDQISVHGPNHYRDRRVDLQLRREAVEIDPIARKVWDDHGSVWEYRELLLATGGWPRRLNVPGAEHEAIHYFRSLEDYLVLESRLPRFRHALVVGGGFIGVELSCALAHAGKGVTLVHQEDHPLRKVLPRDLGRALADMLRERGIEAVSGETIDRFEAVGGEVQAHTRNGNHVATEQVVVGIGIEPAADLADAVGIAAGDGIEVDEEGRTSAQHVWAAGDVAEFPCLALDQRMRFEHWDHALHHGRAVGANMAGASRPYTHLPMFWSDLFELHVEAVGEVDSALATHAVWKDELREGVLFYLRDEVVRGVLLWNVRDRLEWARGLVREHKPVADAEREALAHVEGSPSTATP